MSTTPPVTDIDSQSALTLRTVLLVDDDKVLQRRLMAVFAESGYDFQVAGSAEQMDAIMATKSVDLVLMDVDLPDANGFELMARLRSQSSISITMLTQKSDLDDRISGLRQGADDYISKPFNSQELMARVEAVLRRSESRRSNSDIGLVYYFGGSNFDTTIDQLSHPGGKLVKLTSKESLLLNAFVLNTGKALSRTWLQFAVNKREWHPSDRSLDVLVGRLRKRLAGNPALSKVIVSERSTGYRFTVPVVADNVAQASAGSENFDSPKKSGLIQSGEGI